MPRSYREIVEKVWPICEQQPERFKTFYDKVYLLLQAIPPGSSILIDEHCTPRSRELFMDLAELTIIEDIRHKDVLDGRLEFSDDRLRILRTPNLRPHKNPYSIHKK